MFIKFSLYFTVVYSVSVTDPTSCSPGDADWHLPALLPGMASLQDQAEADHCPSLRPPDLPTCRLELKHEDVITEARSSPSRLVRSWWDIYLRSA